VGAQSLQYMVSSTKLPRGVVRLRFSAHRRSCPHTEAGVQGASEQSRGRGFLKWASEPPTGRVDGPPDAVRCQPAS